METINITFEIFSIFFFVGLSAGFLDSIAGGGGLIALPALLSIGIPPQIALGTNKLQGSFGTFSATINFIRKGEVSLKSCGTGILFTFLGAVLGSWTVQQLQTGFIKHLIPVLLLIILIYTYFSPNLGVEERKPSMKEKTFFILFGLMLGFYDGFFGPGTGSFWTAGLMMLLGLNMTKASGYTRVMNFTSNICALVVFIAGGKVLWSIGLCMAGGQVIGARIGSGMAIKNGAKFIRPFFMTVVLITVIRLLYVNYL